MASELLNSLVNQFAGPVLEQIAAKLGISASTVKKVAPMVISLVMGSMVRTANQPGGAQKLQGLLDVVGNDKALASGDLGSFVSGFDVTKSTDLLQMLAGGNSVSNLVGNVADKAGISSKAASGLMGALAPMAVGSIAKMSQEKGLDIGGLTSLLATEVKGLGDLGDIDKLLDSAPGLWTKIRRALKG